MAKRKKKVKAKAVKSAVKKVVYGGFEPQEQENCHYIGEPKGKK